MPSRRAVVAAVGAVFAVVVASGSPLHSGRFVPVVEQVAALKCPQSLGTLDGTGHCIGLTPLGAAMVDGPGADIFVQCNAQMAPPQGNRFIYRYPFKAIDPTTGTPIFASPISMNTTGVFPAPIYNLSLATLRPKTVWRDVDGRVRLAAFTSDYLHMLTLCPDGKSWCNLTSVHYARPAEWSGLASAVVTPALHGGWSVFGTMSTGVSSRTHMEGSGHTGWRAPAYQPYAGDGIYRFNIATYGVVAFDVSASGVSSGYRAVTPAGWSGGLGGLSLTAAKLANQRVLVAGSHFGVAYTIPINVSTGGSNAVAPVGVVDSTTGVLFTSTVIGGLSMAYPRDGSASDDIVFGGEASLHYTAATPSVANGQTTASPELRLRHTGPVLEWGAVLSTGQTPTVHAADWDGDGVVDIVAGSSEGRIFIAKGVASGGFMSAVPLQIAGADGRSSELLVQGGYRRDIQGPLESRWGYTAAQAVDWNGDGLLDLLVSDNSAATSIYLRFRAADGTLALRPSVQLMLEGLELHGTWRNGPSAAVVDGLMTVVTSDEQDEVHLYHRIDDFNVGDSGKIWVRDPLNSSALSAVQTNYFGAGGTGRLKYAWVDWNRDGRLDLLLGTCGYHSIPSNLTGLPACAPGTAGAGALPGCRENGATVLLMRQSQSQPDHSRRTFEWPEWVTTGGRRISYGGQEVGMSPFDAGDGRTSLIVATPGGRHVFWAADDLGLSTTEPPV